MRSDVQLRTREHKYGEFLQSHTVQGACMEMASQSWSMEVDVM